jgi:hypothetical protein
VKFKKICNYSGIAAKRRKKHNESRQGNDSGPISPAPSGPYSIPSPVCVSCASSRLSSYENFRPVQVRQQFSTASGSERASQHRRIAQAPLAPAGGTEIDLCKCASSSVPPAGASGLPSIGGSPKPRSLPLAPAGGTEIDLCKCASSSVPPAGASGLPSIGGSPRFFFVPWRLGSRAGVVNSCKQHGSDFSTRILSLTLASLAR